MAIFENEFRLAGTFNGRLGHDGLDDVRAARQIKHHVLHDGFDNGPQAPGPGVADDCFMGNRVQRRFRKFKLGVIQAQELLVLFHQRILRFGENADQVFLSQFLQGGNNRNPADELGNDSKLHQVFRHDLLHDRLGLVVTGLRGRGAEADGFFRPFGS